VNKFDIWWDTGGEPACRCACTSPGQHTQKDKDKHPCFERDLTSDPNTQVANSDALDGATPVIGVKAYRPVVNFRAQYKQVGWQKILKGMLKLRPP
jgi:hypothetical protein